jgi:hypothetical protein
MFTITHFMYTCVRFQMALAPTEYMVVGTDKDEMMLLGPTELSSSNLNSSNVLDTVHFLMNHRSYQGVVMYKSGMMNNMQCFYI